MRVSLRHLAVSPSDVTRCGTLRCEVQCHITMYLSRYRSSCRCSKCSSCSDVGDKLYGV